MGDLSLVKSNEKCLFCGHNKKNEVKYGPLYKLNNITAHYYCVLLSNRMVQRGEDNEGMLGFLVKDIKEELQRSKTAVCRYCKNNHATMRCCKKKCKAIYHFNCGLKNGALFLFFGEFRNFCKKHRTYQKIPREIVTQYNKEKVICPVCHQDININNLNNGLWAPCCQKTWFHRKCIQEMALSSGYLFKCPICNDAKKFRSEMLANGIHIPDKDASWELVPNAFEELLFRYNKCDAVKCECPNGRQKNLKDTVWEIVLCRTCGSQGTHMFCGKLKLINPQWDCPMCKEIIKPKNDLQNTDSDIIVRKGQDVLENFPSSSKMNTIKSAPTSLKKKRKISESTEDVKRKRRKIQKQDCYQSINKKESTTLINAASENSSRESSDDDDGDEKIQSPSPCSNGDEKTNETSDDEDVNVVSCSNDEFTEIVIDSSESECEIIDVVHASDDEIEVIKEIENGSNNKEAPLSFGRYLYKALKYISPVNKSKK